VKLGLISAFVLIVIGMTGIASAAVQSHTLVPPRNLNPSNSYAIGTSSNQKREDGALLAAAAAFAASAVPSQADSVESVIRLSGAVTRALARCGDSEGVFKNTLTRISLSPPVQDIYVNDRDRFDSALKRGIEDFEGFVARSNLSTACQYVASMSKTQ
jgi:hypothetical protein